MKLLLCLLLLTLSVAPATAAVTPLTVPVWPGLAPGETTSDPGRLASSPGDDVTRLTDVTAPQLLVFRPDDKPGHPAVLVFPGGAYSILAADLEGTEIAHWLNGLGYVAAVLHYRVRYSLPNKRDAAYQDARRAVSLVRARASEFGVDTGRIGVIGFSAGAHLAARLAASTGARAYPAVDAVDAVSCRPDFVVLIYPAYLVDNATGKLAPEVQPHAGMPPLFVAQTRLDPNFCLLPYVTALRGVGVLAEALIYDGGGHGYGLRAKADQPASHWPDEAAAWLREQTAPPGVPK